MRAIVAICAIALLAASGSAESIKWTGIVNNGQWDTANNWYPNQVPGPQDDVTIDKGIVTITSPVTVNSIGMGTAFSEPANLTIDSTLNVGTLTVDGNGNLIMASGAAMVSGTVQIEGNLIWSVGMASGTWTISSRGVASLIGQGEKTFSGCGFSSAGTMTATGLIVLNQSSQVTVSSTLTASGDFSVQAQDNTAVILDTSAGTLTYTGNGNFAVQAPIKLGTFNFQGGNITIYDSITFANSFAVPSGSVVKSLGMAEVMIPQGLTGSGSVKAEGASLVMGNANFSGTLTAQSGMVSFSAASSVATLVVDGASINTMHALNVNSLSRTSGSINGNSTITAMSTSLTSSGFNINASLVLSGNATVMGSTVSFGAPNGKITVTSGATLTTSSTVQLAGPSGTGGVVNHGTLNVQGALSFQNIDLTGTGSVTVSDTLHVNTVTIGQSLIALTGNGVFKGSTTDITNIAQITGSPSVTGTIGSYSFSCGAACKNVKTAGIPTSKFNFAIGN